MTLTIDPTLQSLIPPLTPEEYAQLEANLRADGCRDPLIIWAEEQVLLDGHNRLQICERHGLDFSLQEISLASLDEAKAWLIANQLGRRNLTPEQMSYYRGEQYNLQKRQGKRTDITSDQSDQKSQTTAERLADQHHVSAPTIRRDGYYADGIEVLAQVLGPEVRQAILAGDIPLTREDVRTLSLLLASDLANQAVAHEAQREGTLAATLQAMARVARCTSCRRPLSDPASISRGIGPICAGHSNGAAPPLGGGADGARSVSPPLTERERAHFGPRTEKEPGTVAWCWQTILLMQSRWKQKTIDEAGFKDLLEELQAHEAWNVVPPEQPYGSLARLVATELGLDLAWFLQDAMRALQDLQLVVAESSSAVAWERTAAGDSVLEQCQALAQAYRNVEADLRQTFSVFDATFVSPPPAPVPQPEPVTSAEGERPADAAAPAIPPYDQAKFQLGKLCPGQHEWGQTGQTLRRKNGRGCQQCDTAKKRHQYAPRKERDGD